MHYWPIPKTCQSIFQNSTNCWATWGIWVSSILLWVKRESTFDESLTRESFKIPALILNSWLCLALSSSRFSIKSSKSDFWGTIWLFAKSGGESFKISDWILNSCYKSDSLLPTWWVLLISLIFIDTSCQKSDILLSAWWVL